MAIIAVTTGKTLVKNEEKKLFSLEDKAAEVGEKRPIELKGVNVACKVKGAVLFLDGKEGKIVAAVYAANETTTTQMFNAAGTSSGDAQGVEISSGELYVLGETASQEFYATAYIEE